MPVPLSTLITVFLRIGLLSFGGPAGQIATMHRILVEEKRWLDEPRFLHALNFCMLLPGPEAQQLATYAGWLVGGVRGGLIAGILFVLPGFLVMAALAAAYVGFAGHGLAVGLFLGLKPAVLAVVIQAGLRIGGRTLRGRFGVLVAVSSFLGLSVFGLPFPVVICLAACVGVVARQPGGDAPGQAAVVVAPVDWRRPMVAALVCLAAWWAPVAVAVAYGQGAFSTIGLLFSKLAVVSFGGAYAALSYVAQQAVGDLGWLAPGEMLDGLGLAETTPGPLVLVLEFVGFLAGYRHPGGLTPWAGAAVAACLTVWVTFVPSFLWIFAGAPLVERLRTSRVLASALSAIAAAVVGVVANLALWFALHVLFDRIDGLWPDWTSLRPVSAALTVTALVAALRFRLGLAWLLVLWGGAGIAIAALA